VTGYLGENAFDSAPPMSLSVTRGRLDTTPPPMGPRCVMVIGDTADTCIPIEETLRADGHETVSCTLQDDVVARVLAARPDLLLVHWTGLEACEPLRSFDAAHARSIVAFGAGNDEDVVAYVLESGADDCIPDARKLREVRARVRAQLRHLRDRELLHWTRRQRSSLRDLAYTDPLTRLGNRRGLGLAFECALEANEPLALALVDIDHFKEVNDTRGHAAGDLVLRLVARALTSVVPQDAFVGRWGGEEFAVIVRNQRGEAVERTSERLRLAVRALDPQELGETGVVTASVGAAAWDGSGPPPTSAMLFSVADEALYESKRSGRDRVTVAHVRAD
jgi:two-component system, cell cycle response regulator